MENNIISGYKGYSNFDAGFIYTPHIPLYFCGIMGYCFSFNYSTEYNEYDERTLTDKYNDRNMLKKYNTNKGVVYIDNENTPNNYNWNLYLTHLKNPDEEDAEIGSLYYGFRLI